MDELIAPVDTIDQALLIARDAIRELKRPRLGESAAEARVRAGQTIKAQKCLIEASRKTVSDTIVAARKVGRANGKATTSAPQITLVDAVEVTLQLAQRALDEVRVLEKRIAEFEARPPPLQYEGTWDEAKTYQRGSFVTHQGGLWFCEDTNIGVRPGSGSPAWKLAVKRGRGDR